MQFLSHAVRSRARTVCHAKAAAIRRKPIAQKELRLRILAFSFFSVRHRGRTKPPKERIVSAAHPPFLRLFRSKVRPKLYGQPRWSPGFSRKCRLKAELQRASCAGSHATNDP